VADSVRTQNLQRFKEKVLKRFPQAAKDEIRKANDKNADEFMAKLRQIVPTDTGELERTIAKEPGRTETAVAVGVGDAETPAGPVEYGHMTGEQGSSGREHVRGRPFFWPARRVLFKRMKNRTARAMTKAAKITAGAQ
jgi:hypothetical protein